MGGNRAREKMQLGGPVSHGWFSDELDGITKRESGKELTANFRLIIQLDDVREPRPRANSERP